MKIHLKVRYTNFNLRIKKKSMGWPLLKVQREEWLENNRWGRMYIRALPTGWDYLCYSYELPWIEDAKGKSKKKVSRIKEGLYEMKVRTDGPKGWRLELLNTGHRKNIQVHRAAPNLYIEGCILPIHFRASNPRKTPASNPKNKTESIKLMAVIKDRYDFFVELEKGKPEIEISAVVHFESGSKSMMYT